MSFSLHLACANRCIYVTVSETVMCSDRHPTRTLNKLAWHTQGVRLNDLTVPEVVSFSCITPSMFFLPFTGHQSKSIKRGKKKVLIWNGVLTWCPLGVTEWMQWIPSYIKVHKTRWNPVSWAKLLVCELQLPPTLMSSSDTGSQPWQSARNLIAGIWETTIHS